MKTPVTLDEKTAALKKELASYLHFDQWLAGQYVGSSDYGAGERIGTAIQIARDNGFRGIHEMYRAAHTFKKGDRR